MRVPVPLSKAWRLFNHGPVTLLTAEHDGVENVMAAAWVKPLDFDPPKLSVVLAADTFTRGLVERSRALVVQVPTCSMLAMIEGVGTHSGREMDKWKQYSIEKIHEPTVRAPLVAGCVAWMATRVLHEPEIEQRYDLFVCEGYAAWADDRVYEEGRLRGDFPEELRTVHHIAGGVYVCDGTVVRAPR